MKNAGIALILLGGIGAIWGFSYTSSHKMEGIGAMFGTTSGLYQAAQVLGPLGLITSLVGLVLLIVAISKQSKAA